MGFVDTTTPFGERAERRLRTDIIGWLTTVRADGTPVPIPVWFFWDGEELLLYSRPGQAKLAHLTARPRVSLHLDSDRKNGDIVTVLGDARLSPSDPPADQLPAYVAKYASSMALIGMTPEAFAAEYSVPFRIRVDALRGH
jgi:PPOX class probable F420-dependent enzyme